MAGIGGEDIPNILHYMHKPMSLSSVCWIFFVCVCYVVAHASRGVSIKRGQTPLGHFEIKTQKRGQTQYGLFKANPALSSGPHPPTPSPNPGRGGYMEWGGYGLM